LRYAGQGYELRTPLHGLHVGRIDAATLRDARHRFDERHAQIHGHAAKDQPVEVVSYRLRLRVAVPKYEPRVEARPARPAAPARKGERTVYFERTSGVPATLHERDALDVGATIVGPAIVEQFDATTVIPPSWHAEVDRYRNLILTRREA
jgi:N-methylhydantoinase A